MVINETKSCKKTGKGISKHTQKLARKYAKEYAENDVKKPSKAGTYERLW